MYDCIIIGAGHNGLICASYLAKKNWKVLVLEKRNLVGGCCVTEELAPGYKASIASYVVSLLLPEIVEDLQLKRHGYRTLPRNPSSFTPFDDGRYLLIGNSDGTRPENELYVKDLQGGSQDGWHFKTNSFSPGAGRSTIRESVTRWN